MVHKYKILKTPKRTFLTWLTSEDWEMVFPPNQMLRILLKWTFITTYRWFKLINQIKSLKFRVFQQRSRNLKLVCVIVCVRCSTSRVWLGWVWRPVKLKKLTLQMQLFRSLKPKFVTWISSWLKKTLKFRNCINSCLKVKVTPTNPGQDMTNLCENKLNAETLLRSVVANF